MIRKILKISLIFSVGVFHMIAQAQERVYLQTDKQLYLAGELLWMKLYTTDIDGKLTSLSKIGYVELVHDSIPEVQVKLDIQNGTGAGWMELPTMLPTGYYRMIAYTRYMRNEEESVFFEKIIGIFNPFNQNDLPHDNEPKIELSYNFAEKNLQSVDVSADKPTYKKRNNGELRIKGLSSENISLGISIAGMDPVLETNITVDGWKKKLAEKNSSFTGERFLPEYEGAIIDGVLIDLETKNPSVDRMVVNLLSFPGPEIQLFAGQADENGNVFFYTQCVTGKKELTTTSITSSDKKHRVDIRSPYTLHTPKHLPLFNPDSTWRSYLQTRNLSLQVTHAAMADSLSRIKEIGPCTLYRPYSHYELDEYTRFSNMEDVFVEFITFARIRRTGEGRRFSMMTENLDNYTNNVLVLFDNIPISNHELMCAYNPLLIKTIDLHLGRYLFGGHLFEGMISFISYKNDYPDITFDENTQLFHYSGTQPYRYFYTPQYDKASVSSRFPDFRHTLLWEPDIQSNGQNELTIPFTTSDISGNYQITVEGIGMNGTVVHATLVIEVE